MQIQEHLQNNVRLNYYYCRHIININMRYSNKMYINFIIVFM